MSTRKKYAVITTVLVLLAVTAFVIVSNASLTGARLDATLLIGFLFALAAVFVLISSFSKNPNKTLLYLITPWWLR